MAKIVGTSGRLLGFIAYVLIFIAVAAGRADMTEASRIILVISLILLSSRYIIDIFFNNSYSKSHIFQATLVTIGSVLWFAVALISPFTDKKYVFIIALEAITLLLMSFFWFKQFIHQFDFRNIAQSSIKKIKENWGVIICILYTLLMSLSTLKWIPIWDEILYTSSIIDSRNFDFTLSNISLICGHLSYAVNVLFFPAIHISVVNPYLSIRIWILFYLLIDAVLIYLIFRKLIPSLSNADATILSIVFLSFTPILGMQSPNLDYIGIIVVISTVFFFYYKYLYLFILSAAVLCFTKEPLAVLYTGFLAGIIIIMLVKKSYSSLKGYILSTLFFSMPLIMWLIVFSLPAVMGIVTGNFQSPGIWGLEIVDSEGNISNTTQTNDEQQAIDTSEPDSKEEVVNIEQTNVEMLTESTENTSVTEQADVEKQVDSAKYEDNIEKANEVEATVPVEQHDQGIEPEDEEKTVEENTNQEEETNMPNYAEILQQEGQFANGFYTNKSYIISKISEILFFHFLWIPLFLMLVLLDLKILRRLSDLLPLIFAVVFYAILNCIYHTYDAYRYVMTGSVLILILSLIGICLSIRKKTVRNRFLFILGVLFVIEQFTIIDPATMYNRDVYSSGNGKFVYLDRDNIQELYMFSAIQSNRQGYEYGNFLEAIMKTIDYDKNTLVLIPEMSFHQNTVSMRGVFDDQNFCYDTERKKIITLPYMSNGKTDILWGRISLDGNIEILGKNKSEVVFDRVFIIAFPFLDNEDYIQGVINQDLKMISSQKVEYGTWAAKAIEVEGIDLFYIENKMASEESSEEQ